MSNINDIKEKRENLVQEMKDFLETYKADEFKYYGTISDFRAIIDELEDLREKELEDLREK